MLVQESRKIVTREPNCAPYGPPRFRDILALGTSTGPWSAALLAAIEIAAPWDAHVTGCFVPGAYRMQAACESEPTVAALLIRDDDDYGKEESAAFQEFAKRLGVRDTSWTVTHTAIAPTLRKLGSWHDLAIVERDIVDDTRLFDILGEAMLGCRIPCLVLPPGWDKAVSFDRIVVAWNGNFEATRALHSSLPLLKRAKEVVLINGEVRAPYDEQVSVVEPDPVAYLMDHDIPAKVKHIHVAANEAGETLLNKAADAKADLLVMGAYGHSRIRERVLGGATRHVLAHATLPVFMQH